MTILGTGMVSLTISRNRKGQRIDLVIQGQDTERVMSILDRLGQLGVFGAVADPAQDDPVQDEDGAVAYVQDERWPEYDSSAMAATQIQEDRA